MLHNVQNIKKVLSDTMIKFYKTTLTFCINQMNFWDVQRKCEASATLISTIEVITGLFGTHKIRRC